MEESTSEVLLSLRAVQDVVFIFEMFWGFKYGEFGGVFIIILKLGR